MPHKPEVMSPAGYWPQLRAAIEAGADSVYFGLKHFTARAKVGFDLDELPDDDVRALIAALPALEALAEGLRRDAPGPSSGQRT